MRSMSAVLLAAFAISCGPSSSNTDDKKPDNNVVVDTGTDDTASVVDADDTMEAANTNDWEWQPWTLYPLEENGYISPAGDRDWYQIDTFEGNIFQIYTESAGELGTVVADTVINLYDENGTLLGENDDMIFRFWQTDSCIFFQSQYDGPYFVEILEFSDWSPDVADAAGGSNFKYELWGARLEVTEHEGFNDTIQAVIDEASEEGYYAGSVFADYPAEFHGMIDADGDVDLYPIETEDDGEPNVYSWSFWPEYLGKMAPVLSLLNSAGEVLATTTEPGAEPEFIFLWDAGILYKLDPAETYYIKVEDGEGNFGPGTYYPGEFHSYVNEFAPNEVEDNNSIDLADPVVFEESTTTAGFFFGRISGWLPATDEVDYFEVNSADAGQAVDGGYLTVQIQANSVGSELDAKVSLVALDGTVLVSATDNPDNDSTDPAIVDYLVDGHDRVFVKVEAEARGDNELAQAWFMSVYISDVPAR